MDFRAVRVISSNAGPPGRTAHQISVVGKENFSLNFLAILPMAKILGTPGGQGGSILGCPRKLYSKWLVDGL